MKQKSKVCKTNEDRGNKP